MIDFVISHASTSAFWAGITAIVGTVAIVVFFSGVAFFGPVNDVASIFHFGLLILVAIALNTLLCRHFPALSVAVTVIGIAAMIVFACAQIALVVRLVKFEQTLRIVMVCTVITGCWMLAISALGMISGEFVQRIGWVGIAAGLGMVIGSLGFLIGGQNNPLASGGFLVSAVAVPLWCIWLSRLLGSS